MNLVEVRAVGSGNHCHSASRRKVLKDLFNPWDGKVGGLIQQARVQAIALAAGNGNLLIAPTILAQKRPNTCTAAQEAIEVAFSAKFDAMLTKVSFVGFVEQNFAVHENTIIIPKYG